MTDIIIPIYNAFSDLQKCIDSVLKYTDFTKSRLILINDMSSDTRVAPYIESLKNDHIIIHHNTENKGFSANVNFGFDCSPKNDVLLLNTDTIVTAGWLSKIEKCAYREPLIGTVTPLSNSATICSIPNFCEDNPLPKGYSVDSFGELVEKYSLHRYPDISVAVGFCMFIKRDVIKQVGYFDAETFKRGYGEENDFCNRATILGYRHVLCDDTFIYHSGTASFVPEEKYQLIQEHEKILFERYPDLMEQNRVFYTSNPIREIQENIKLRLLLNNNKRNLLYLAQRDFASDASEHTGGTQFHVQDLTMNMRFHYNVFVLARDRSFMRLTAYTDKQSICMKFYVGPASGIPVFSDSKFIRLYSSILDTFKIDIIHIQHVYQQPLDLFYMAKQRNIPLLCTLHDFYYLCPTIKLIDKDQNCCIESHSTLQCKECLKCNRELDCTIPEQVDYINAWREKTRNALKCCDAIVVPSESTKKIYADFFPELEAKIKVIAHGIDIQSLDQTLPLLQEKSKTLKCGFDNIPSIEDPVVNIWCQKPWDKIEQFGIILDHSENHQWIKVDISDTFNAEKIHFKVRIPLQYLIQGCKMQIVVDTANGKQYTGSVGLLKPIITVKPADFTVAFVGGLTPAKGSKLANQMIENGPRDINWIVLGAASDRELKFKSQGNYIYTHWYERENLSQLIKLLKIDLVCVLPIWPETYCYVLSEVLNCKIPVLATDIGALPERIKRWKCGWLVPASFTSKEVLDKIDWIRKNPEEYCAAQKNASIARERSVTEMAADYRKLYEEHYTNPLHEAGNISAFLKALADRGGEYVTQEDIMRRYQMLENELSEVKGSQTYKLLVALKKLDVPALKKIKNIIFWALKRLKLDI